MASSRRQAQQPVVTVQPLGQRIAGGDVVSGLLAQGGLRCRVVQGIDNALGNPWVIEEIDQPAVFPMTDDFTHRRGVGADDQTSAGHGFEHGPGKDKGVGKVNVRGRNLQDTPVAVIGQFAEKVGAGGVEGNVAAEFFPPVGGILGALAVAHVVATDDQGLAVGVLALNDSQGAQKAVNAPVGFEVASNVGDDRVAGFYLGAVGQEVACLRVGAEVLGANAFVQYVNPGLEKRGMHAALPGGRTDTFVAQSQIEDVQGIPGANAGMVVERGGKFRVKADIGAVGVVVPLAKVDQPGIRKDVAQIERVAPAGVGEHDVGGEALALELQIGARGSLAGTYSALHWAQVGMAAGLVAGRAVAQMLQARHARRLGCAQADDAQVLALGPMGSQMAELPWEVGMDEQNIALRRDFRVHGGLSHA